MALRARWCVLILSLITRLPCVDVGDHHAADVVAEQHGQQSDRLCLNLGGELLKRQPRVRRMKECGLRESWSVHEPWHQHLLRGARIDAVLVARCENPDVALFAATPSPPARPRSRRPARPSFAADNTPPTQTSMSVFLRIRESGCRRDPMDTPLVQI